MEKKYKYHKVVKFTTNDNIKHEFTTQLYEIGIYGILDNNPALQGSYHPKKLIKIEKSMKKDLKSGKLFTLDLLYPTIVIETNEGFFKENN